MNETEPTVGKSLLRVPCPFCGVQSFIVMELPKPFEEQEADVRKPRTCSSCGREACVMDGVFIATDGLDDPPPPVGPTP